jgi:endogenous inhibitor of DNA gyrase (YacG/DUF329 family)
MSKPSTPRQRRNGCPLCGAPAVAAHTPFCSQGCRDRDLLNWLGDAYRVPAARPDGETDEIDPNRLDSDAKRPL